MARRREGCGSVFDHSSDAAGLQVEVTNQNAHLGFLERPDSE